MSALDFVSQPLQHAQQQSNLCQVLLKHRCGLHHATNPSRFTDNAGALDFYIGDHRPLYPEIDSVRDFTYQMSDHLPLWIQLDTWIEDEQLDSVLAEFGDPI